MGVDIEYLVRKDEGRKPVKGDIVVIHYIGTLKSNGNKFDSSRDRGEPFETQIGIGRVIKGWDEGVPQLRVGEKAILHITSDYAYGSKAIGAIIPANSDLDFEVELLNIK